MKTNINNKLISLSDKIADAERAFYRAAEDYLRSAIKKQKDEKIDLSNADLYLYAKHPDEDKSNLDTIEYLYFDSVVGIRIDGYNYLLADLTIGSVIRLVEWVKKNV